MRVRSATRSLGTITALSALGVLLPQATAQAGPPEIHERSCESSGGVFDRTRGLKSCTWTATHEVAGPDVSAEATVPQGPYYYSLFVGVSRRVELVQTVTTRTQRGNGEVRQTSVETVLSSRLEPLHCLEGNPPYPNRFDHAPMETCEALGLFVA